MKIDPITRKDEETWSHFGQVDGETVINDAIDALGDIIFISVGSMFKYGINKHEAAVQLISSDLDLDIHTAENITERIYKWNEDRQNTDYSVKREYQMILEEFFEYSYAFLLQSPGTKMFCKTAAKEHPVPQKLSSHFFISTASISATILESMGANVEVVVNRICDANDKKGSKKDAQGKIIKNTDEFVEPQHVRKENGNFYFIKKEVSSAHLFV